MIQSFLSFLNKSDIDSLVIDVYNGIMQNIIMISSLDLGFFLNNPITMIASESLLDAIYCKTPILALENDFLHIFIIPMVLLVN